MPKFYSKELAELAHQLNLSPRRLRVTQLQAVEALLGLIDADRAYPFDFVCFRITGYHKRGAPNDVSLAGKALIADLVTLAEACSRKANLPVAELGEAYATHQQLADELSVSTKTVRRWRVRGLMGLRAVFEDGVNRLVFCRTTVDRFVRQHKDLVARGASFKQLTAAERDRIIGRARELVAQRPLKLHAAARIIAEETGRAIETIRYTLRRHDAGAAERSIFRRNGEAVCCEREAGIWRCHQAGEATATIAQAFACSPADVEQVLRTVQVRLWRQEPPQYVPNELFDAPHADQLILEAAEPPGGDGPLPRAPKDLPPYLRSLYAVPLLTREQEQDLFRRYNFVKFKTARLLAAIDPAEVTTAQFARITTLTRQVDELRQRIIRANLRLVVSIAKKHVGWSSAFFEVVSDGNMSLMRAAEKFDFARGTKFSTYASWAIMKNYARSIPEQHYHYTRYVTGQDGVIDAVPDAASARTETYQSDRQHVRKLIQAGMKELPDREREIVANHFGLGGKGNALTLDQLGKRFGVTKERVRQIEQRALAHLREVLSPALADTL